MAISPYAQFKTDDKIEQDGIFLDYGHFRLKIARAGGANQKFQKVMSAKFKPHRRAMNMDSMDEDLARRLLIESYAEAIILGWDSKDDDGKIIPTVLDENNKPMEFTRENCIKLLTDLPDLFSDIQQQAGAAANFKAEDRKTLAKNSKPSSSGN